MVASASVFREVDLIGQLTDLLYVVILHRPRGVRRRRYANASWPHSPTSPVTLSIVEITEPAHLAQVLAGINARDELS
jgi:hypothetical protein